MMKQRNRGFSVLEVAIVIVIVGILTATGIFAYSRFTVQAGDASAVQSAQSSLQAVIIQAASRAETAPTALDKALVVNSVNTSANMQITADANGYSLNIPNTGRGATYSVSNNGDVLITSLKGFDKYSICGNGQKLCSGSLTSTIGLGSGDPTKP